MAEEIYMSIKSDVKSATQDTQEYANTLKKAQGNVKEVNASLQAQNKFILDQEKELLKLKAIQDSIPEGAFYAGQPKLTADIKKLTSEIKAEKLGLKELKLEQKDATEKVKEFNKAQKDVGGTLMDDIKNYKVFGISLNGIGNGFRKIIPAAKAAFASITAGIISTGIGALVIAFAAFVTYLTQTKKGAELLQRALAGMGAVVKVLIDRVSGLVGAIGKLFSGDIKGGLSDMGDQFKGIGEEIAKESRLAVQLKRDLQTLVDSERELNVEFAQRRAEIEKLKLKSEDLNLTEKERLKALEDASAIETKLNAKKVANAEEAVRIGKTQISMGENLEADLQRVADLEIKLANIKRESARRQTTVETRANTIRRKAIAERKKDEEDLAAKEKEKQDAQLATIAEFDKLTEDQRIKNIEDLEERERAEAERKNQIRLDSINATIFDEQEKDKVLLQNKEIFETEQKAIFDKFRAQYEAESDEDAEKEKQRQKAVRDAKVGMAKSGLQLVSAIAGRGSKIAKAAAVAQATISGVQGVQNAYTTAQSSPITVAFPGYPIVQAGLAAAFSAVQIRNIMSSGSSKGGTAAGLGGGGAVGGTPSPQMMGGGFTLQDQEPPEAIKAFVVTDEMTSSQNQLANIRRRSTI